MNLYPWLKPLLFQLDPETAHHLTLEALNLARLSRLPLFPPPPAGKPVTVMGLNFPNRLGLAAGLDKNGDYLDALGALGFGGIEIGTVTPRPQPGNPKPRLFRLPEQQAIINRMGFNNLGLEHLLENVRRRHYTGILGINIGKNADTPIQNAAADYLTGLRKAYPYADYITVNISSPNTQNLRQLQQSSELKSLLEALKNEQLRLQTQHGRRTPLAVKIAPDLSDPEIAQIAELLLEYEIEAVIAANTTLRRDKVQNHPLANQAGGLSGRPLKTQADHVVNVLAQTLQGKIPIIAAGGVLSAADAKDKLAAGASLVQIYSGLIYRGPELIHEILAEC